MTDFALGSSERQREAGASSHVNARSSRPAAVPRSSRVFVRGIVNSHELEFRVPTSSRHIMAACEHPTAHVPDEKEFLWESARREDDATWLNGGHGGTGEANTRLGIKAALSALYEMATSGRGNCYLSAYHHVSMQCRQARVSLQS